MSESFDHTFDVVVVGSGGAAFATALGAADEGLSVVMLESTDKWGGSTAMSGGGMWLPNNPLMQRAGVGDSRDEALAYMEATVGDTGASTSRARKEAFVDGVADFVLTAEKYGMRFARATDYPDYYPELPGGKIGRAIEAQPFDAKRIGEWWSTSRALLPLPMMTNDVWLMGRSWSSPSGMVRGAQFVGRTLGGLLTGKRLVGIGAGLAAQFCHAVTLGLRVPLWLNAPVTELLVENDRVVGVRIQRAGGTQTIHADRGVMLAGGGFDHNAEWRQRYQGIDGSPSGNPGNIGGPLRLAMDLGVAVELMDDAWWGASTAPLPGGQPGFIVGERSMPFSIMVDAQGRRFANESESYVDLGHHMLAHDKDGAYWLVADARHAHRYLRSYAMDPRALRQMRELGLMVKADSIPALAAGMGADAEMLAATIERFNGFARAGIDGDFGRGNSAYDRYYSDPAVHPNPCLGPLEKAPFTAFKVVIGDLGTKGGVVTDADGRALRADGSVIDGLYSAGNNSASVMGRTYPGPGSTIAPAVVFGLRAARHMARTTD